MTTEPKFIPETAVPLQLEGGGECRVRLIDCVGYMVEGAMGHEENEKPRMVKSPWFDEAVPFDLAAETGTEKVIRDHSTIGVVVTTDGSISDIPRAGYEKAEARVIGELEELGKPYVILLNSAHPDSPETRQLAAVLEEQYGRSVLPVSCVDLDAAALEKILESVLYEFPVRELDFAMPKWVTMLDSGHWLRVPGAGAGFCDAQMGHHAGQRTLAPEQRLRGGPQLCGQHHPDEGSAGRRGGRSPGLRVDAAVGGHRDGPGGRQRQGDGGAEAGLMPCIIELARAKKEYERLRSAIEQVEATGYGIVMPSIDELHLEQPEIVRQGGRYGVRLEASAPSIHMMRAVIRTEISPIVGSERQSEELVQSLLSGFEDDPVKIWESNIFGKSLHELVNEGLQAKLLHMPQEARTRMQETLERVINEGCTGLICILL